MEQHLVIRLYPHMPALEEAPSPPKCAVANDAKPSRWKNLQEKTDVEIYIRDEMSELYGFKKVHIDDFTSL